MFTQTIKFIWVRTHAELSNPMVTLIVCPSRKERSHSNDWSQLHFCDAQQDVVMHRITTLQESEQRVMSDFNICIYQGHTKTFV